MKMPEFIDSSLHDFMAKSSVLRRHGMKREFFDPTNPVHIDSLVHYLQTGSWKQQFFPEDPFLDVPATVFRKYMGHALCVDVTTQQKIATQQVEVPKIVPSLGMVRMRRTEDERVKV
jgi:hypothetical protein